MIASDHHQSNGHATESNYDSRKLGIYAVPPQHLDSERAILGGAIISDVARREILASVTPTQFYLDIHANILRIVARLDIDGKLTGDTDGNTTTIVSAISESGIGNDITGGIIPFLLELMGAHQSHFVDFHCGRVTKAAMQRKLISDLEESTRLAWAGESADELCQRLVTTAETIRAGLTPGKPAFSTMTAAELDAADCFLEYLVADILVSGQPCVLAASKKSLKTTLAIDLQLSLASGSPFVGKFYVPNPVRVALMSGESGDATIQETARRIARSKPWKNLSDYENAIFSFDLPRLGQPQTKRELIDFITTHRLRVLIIDPAYLCLDLGDDAGNLFSVGKKLRELTDIGHATGCTIVIIHHCRKSGSGQDQFSPPELESIAWSGFQEWARQWILIGRREAYNPESAGTHKLWLSSGGSAGHSGLWGLDIEEGSRTDPQGRRWDVSIDGASAVIAEKISQKETAKEQQAREKEERTLRADAEKMLRNYRLKTDGDTEKSIREKSRLSGARAGAANDFLLAQGLIEPCTVIKNRRNWDGFKIVPQPSGLIGTDRDSIGTDFACPDDALERDYYPKGGSPGPAHHDINKSPSETVREFSPDDLKQIGDSFGGRPA